MIDTEDNNFAVLEILDKEFLAMQLRIAQLELENAELKKELDDKSNCKLTCVEKKLSAKTKKMLTAKVDKIK